MLNITINEDVVIEFLNLIKNNTFSLFTHYNEITNNFHHGGFAVDDAISMKKYISLLIPIKTHLNFSL